MYSVTTERFRKCYAHLPSEIREATQRTYKLWLSNNYHPSLQFKQIHSKPIFSVRIGMSWRAIGLKEENTMIWFWIGSHEDYNQLIKNLN